MRAIYDQPLPDGWSEEPLGKAVVTRRGYTWEKADEVDRAEADTVPVIRIPNVQDTLDLTDLIHLRNVSPEALEKAAVTKDWLLFVGSNGTQDRIGDSVLIEEDRPMVFASFLMGIQPKDQGRLRSDFFAHWMRMHLVHEIFSKTSQQTTGLANFSWGAVKKLPVRFPTCVNEQRRIAAALRLADEAVQKARTELDATRELTRSLMSELFVHGVGLSRRSTQQTKLGVIPKDWGVSELRKFWTTSANGLYVPEDLYGSGVPIIRIDTFNDGFFYTHEFKRIRVRKEDVQSYAIEEGDLLVNRVNSIPFLGKVAYVDSAPEFTVFESNMMRLRFPTKEMAKYLSLYLSVPAIKKRIWAMGRPAVAQLSINQRDVGKFLVAMPSADERREIVDAVTTAKQAEDRAAVKLSAMLEVKRSLLQNLLTGKIRIPEEALHA